MNVKKIVILISGILLFSAVFKYGGMGQELSPATWRFSAKKIDDKTFEVRINASITPPWYIYALEVPEGKAIPTSINFNKNPLVTLQGKTAEDGKAESKMEDSVVLKYYSNGVEFVRVLKLRTDVKTMLNGPSVT